MDDVTGVLFPVPPAEPKYPTVSLGNKRSSATELIIFAGIFADFESRQLCVPVTIRNTRLTGTSAADTCPLRWALD